MFTHVWSKLGTLLLLVGVVLAQGAKAQVSTLDKTVRAAIVPDADFVIAVDAKALGQTSISKKIESLIDLQRQKGAIPGAKVQAEKMERIKAATGMVDDGVTAFLLTARAGNIEYGADRAARLQSMLKTNGVMAFGLAKPIGAEALKTVIEVMTEDLPDVELWETEIDGSSAYLVKPAAPNTPSAYVVTSEDRRVVFVSFNEASLQAALARGKSGSVSALSPALAKVEKILPDTPEMCILFLAPDALRSRVQARVRELQQQAQQQPNMGMMAGFAAPFQDLESLCLGIKFGDSAIVTLATHLGGEQQALQVAALLQTMLTPMLHGLVAKYTKGQPSPMLNSLKVQNTGPAVMLSMTFSQQDLAMIEKQLSPPPPPPAEQ